MKLCNDVIKKIVEIIGNDEQIQNLLVFNHSEDIEKVNLEYMIKNKYIGSYPVILSANDKNNFVNVYLDNSIKDDDNVYVATFNIACGVSMDEYITDDGDIRAMLIAQRIEDLLDGLRIEGCTGELILSTISNITWTEFLNGYSLIFQIVEMDDIDETVL